jgi:valyl-tRNA synthetase
MNQTELPKAYEPKAIEPRVYDEWMRAGVFGAEAGSSREPYTICIPPPNITGRLHMGHALNNTIQDILTRWQRMMGKNALWLPGTDHAGIATQAVVEKELAKQGIKRRELGREKFLERVWAWRDQYGSAIVEQLKKMGSSCDWSRLRFTLDEGLSRAVRKVFVDLYRRGHIYRGEYLVNWCPKDQTALSDEEVEHEQKKGKLYHIKYPGVDGGPGVQVATTRPETMLGDVAVAVNPEDERYRDLVGKFVMLPLMNRKIPVIADSFVSKEFGTGAVKITPAHDPNDFAAGQRHGLTPINIMNPDGSINQNGGAYAGMDRFKAREEVVKALEADGLLVKIDEHENAVGTCYRCHSVVEPYLSTQWFVRMKELAEPALECVRDGRVKFHPARWTNVYFQWMENIRDWCISRQLWWGHRIPAFYCKKCNHAMVSETDVTACEKCGSSEIRQDDDVLDTWFSSGLWPFSTLGWPDETPDLKTFYPTSTLVTDRGIIFFWVARMIMSGLAFRDQVPFSDVYIHGTILDKHGAKMSKSKGNGIDPLEVIEKFGADAMRFSLMMLSSGGQDIKLSEDKFEMGRNFANKIWNAARFLMMNLKAEDADPTASSAASGDGSDRSSSKIEGLEFADRWILSRLARVTATVDESLKAFDFYGAAKSLYDFTWHEYCDWYVEFVKPRFSPTGGTQEGTRSRKAAVATARHVLQTTLALLHPFMPYVTEEIHRHLTGSGTLLAKTAWPRTESGAIDEAVEDQMERVQKVITAVRTIRSAFSTKDNQLRPHTEVDVLVKADPGGKWSALVANENLVKSLAKVRSYTVSGDVSLPKGSASEIVEDIEVYVPLAGLIDYKKEQERLSRDLASKKKDLETVQKKLSQETFVANAPAEIVEKEKQRQGDLLAAIRKIENLLQSLGQ